MKKTSLVCYYLVPILILASFFIFKGSAFYNILGRIAEIILIIILFASPVSKLKKTAVPKFIMRNRGPLGVATFWFALAHSVPYIIKRDLFTLSKYLPVSNHLLWGILAMIGMTILAITSNKLSMRLLKANWKRVQYIVSFVLFATLLHIAIASEEFIILGVVIFKYLILKIISKKN